jgi:hypothetical protein
MNAVAPIARSHWSCAALPKGVWSAISKSAPPLRTHRSTASHSDAEKAGLAMSLGVLPPDWRHERPPLAGRRQPDPVCQMVLSTLSGPAAYLLSGLELLSGPTRGA